MQLLLLIPPYLRRQEYGAYTERSEALEWFVIATLCFFFFLLGCFAAVTWQIWRRTTRPQPHVQLLMELAESDEDKVIQKADETARAESPAQEPWERPPDWWKKSRDS